jgi:acyl carrier protein
VFSPLYKERGHASNLIAKVREIVAEHFRIDPNRLSDDARFREDLGADWLDRLEMLIAIEDLIPGFEIADVVAGQIDTVGDLMRTIEGRDLRISGRLTRPRASSALNKAPVYNKGQRSTACQNLDPKKPAHTPNCVGGMGG